MLAGLLVLLCPQAAADLDADIVRAANADLEESVRLAAFDDIVGDYDQNAEQIQSLAQDDEADPRQRWVAVRVLGRSGDSEIGEVLRGLCEDDRPTIRVAAISALGDTQGRNTARFISGYLDDPALVVRATAADTLALLRDPTTVGALEQAMLDRSNYYRGQSVWARKRYVLAMGAIGSRLAFPALGRALEDEDQAVVDATLIALRQIVGYDFAEGRSREEHIQAWQRWLAAQ